MEPCVVMKFGGTSVQDAAAIRRLVEAVAAEPRPRVLVVSALAGVTDALSDVADGRMSGAAAADVMSGLLERHIAIVHELVTREAQPALIERLRRRFEKATRVASGVASGFLGSPKLGTSEGGSRKERHDAVLAVGELASSDVVAAVLDAAGVEASWVDARHVIVTDAGFGHARPQPAAIRAAAARHLQPLLAVGRVPVLGGFIGADADGATTTLGRGGSDYSAALLGAAIGAQEIQIWTDVDGVLTSDPRVVERATLVPELSFHEAYELARFGAKVLHWGTLEPAASHDIPVRVLNSRARGGPGTTITGRSRRGAPSVVGLAQQGGVTVADVRARGVTGSLRFLHAALDWLAHEHPGLNVVTLSAARLVVVAADEDAITQLLAVLEDVADTNVMRDAAIVTAVGDGITGHADVWSVLTSAVRAGHVESVVAAHSGDALVCVTSRSLAPRVLARLHDRFFGLGSDPIHGSTQGRVAARPDELRWPGGPLERTASESIRERGLTPRTAGAVL